MPIEYHTIRLEGDGMMYDLCFEYCARIPVNKGGIEYCRQLMIVLGVEVSYQHIHMLQQLHVGGGGGLMWMKEREREREREIYKEKIVEAGRIHEADCTSRVHLWAEGRRDRMRVAGKCEGSRLVGMFSYCESSCVCGGSRTGRIQGCRSCNDMVSHHYESSCAWSR